MFNIRWLKCGRLLLIGGLHNLPTAELDVVCGVVVVTLHGVK